MSRLGFCRASLLGLPVALVTLSTYARSLPPSEAIGLGAAIGTTIAMFALFGPRDDRVTEGSVGRFELAGCALIAVLATYAGLEFARWATAATAALAVAVTASFLASRVPVQLRRALVRAGDGARWSSQAVLLSGVLYAAYWEAEPFLQSVEFGAPLASAAARLLGWHASVDGRGLGLATGEHRSFFGISPRHGEVFPSLLFCGYVAVSVATSRSLALRERVLRCAAAVLAVLTWREILVLGKATLTSTDSWHLEMAMSTELYLLAQVPALVAIAALEGRPAAVSARPEPRKLRLTSSAFALSVALLVFPLLWIDHGTPKAGRIAIDDAHSDWEWSTIPLNKTVFGPKTTYNYWSMNELLGRHFSELHVNEEDVLDSDTLRSHDVWILKTPTRPYTSEELSAIHQYVQDGGGVWLIGDHTDIFGMNTYLNQVSERYSIHFNTDAVGPQDWTGRVRQLWTPPRRSHPIAGQIQEFQWATSCSLGASPWTSDVVMAGHALSADGVDYALNTGFGDHIQDASEPYGRMLQCVAVRSGRGRVLAFSDSTVFSSFFFHIPGKPELAIGSVWWLNHSNGSDRWRYLLFLLGCALAATVTTAAIRRDNQPTAGGVVIGALTGLSLAAAASMWAARNHHPEPADARDERDRVAFVSSDDRVLPARTSVSHDESSPVVFQTLFVWTQRAGLVPEFEPQVPVDASRFVGLVLISPDGLAEESLDRLATYVHSGGNVLVLSENGAALRTILGTLGNANSDVVELSNAEGGTETQLSLHRSDSWETILLPDSGLRLRGVDAILTTRDDEIVLGVVRHGAGHLYLSTTSAGFSNAWWGGTTMIPTKSRYAAYELYWDLIDRWSADASR